MDNVNNTWILLIKVRSKEEQNQQLQVDVRMLSDDVAQKERQIQKFDVDLMNLQEDYKKTVSDVNTILKYCINCFQILYISLS